MNKKIGNGINWHSLSGVPIYAIPALFIHYFYFIYPEATQESSQNEFKKLRKCSLKKIKKRTVPKISRKSTQSAKKTFL